MDRRFVAYLDISVKSIPAEWREGGTLEHRDLSADVVLQEGVRGLRVEGESLEETVEFWRPFKEGAFESATTSVEVDLDGVEASGEELALVRGESTLIGAATASADSDTTARVNCEFLKSHNRPIRR